MSDTSMNPVPEKPVNDGGGGNAPQTGEPTGSEQAEGQPSQETSSD